MKPLSLQHTLSGIQKNMSEFAPQRHSDLFEKFLVEGYAATTLSKVPEQYFECLLRAKLCLGSLITLYDDYADNPKYLNPSLLETLYKLDIENYNLINIRLNSQELSVLRFAQSLFAEINEILKHLPHYLMLLPLFKFDLLQFYTANKYSTILTQQPEAHSVFENTLYCHHNMGMVMTGMMDLMAIPHLNVAELGQIREVLLLGQRMGRIFNVLYTYERELRERDRTSEIPFSNECLQIRKHKNKLEKEINSLARTIECFDLKIHSFSVRTYLNGLHKLENLHIRMEKVL